MGIIDSLSAGYRFVGRRLGLLLIPVALDLLLWQLPALSIRSLVQRLVDFYVQLARQPSAPSELAPMLTQMAEFLKALGDSSNLLAGLVSGSLLHMPSLVVSSAAIKWNGALPITNAGAALVIWLACSVVGLLIGVFYLGLLAEALPIGAGAKSRSWSEFIPRTLRQWGRVLAFVVMTTIALLVVYIPASLVISVVFLLLPPLGTLFAVLLMGFVLLILFYLYFVTAAIVLDDLPLLVVIPQSMWLVRRHFVSVLGFVTITNLIGLGMGLLFNQLAAQGSAGVAIAIVANAFIGTGLAMALLVFYRSRVLVEQQQTAKADNVS